MTDGAASGTEACLRAGLLRVEGRMLVADTRMGTLQIAATPQQARELVWTPAGASVPEVRVALPSATAPAAPVVVEPLPGPQRAVCVRQGGVRHAFFWLQDAATTAAADAQRVARFNAVLARLCTAVPPVSQAATQASFLERLNARAASDALTTLPVCSFFFSPPCTLGAKRVTATLDTFLLFLDTATAVVAAIAVTLVIVVVEREP